MTRRRVWAIVASAQPAPTTVASNVVQPKTEWQQRFNNAGTFYFTLSNIPSFQGAVEVQS